ncbi:tetraacyldisaccharide 4'-kinase [Pedobacter immunditicola]|uniref:tetraacyldisaccharide 4'-kinase n=1 Tax=Pedobacter immunditicola TaxID=3133440 RepID=UPI0030A1F4AF
MLIFEAQMINVLRLLLLPFSLIYGLVVIIRNKCYDRGIFKSRQFNLPVICVGNLVVGGSGKTPLTEYLVSLLSNYKIAILSRGYGRNTKGFILADGNATAQSIGDEPMQFYNKFPQVTVAVCEDRVKGIEQLEASHDLIILDDAFQHRRVRAGFNILLFEYSKLLRQQFLLPAGNLREPFSGYQRAQAILVTKMPSIFQPGEKSKIEQQFAESWKPAFSGLKYNDLIPVFSGDSRPMNTVSRDTVVFLLSGIANPAPLLNYLESWSSAVLHHDYPDHHQFSTAEITKLVQEFKQEKAAKKIIITTEKDAQRLSAVDIKQLLLNLPLFYLPIKIDILEEDKLIFDQNIINYVSSYQRNR